MDCIVDADCAEDYSNAFCCEKDWCLEDDSNATAVCFCSPNYVGARCETVLYWVYGLCSTVIVSYLVVTTVVLVRKCGGNDISHPARRPSEPRVSHIARFAHRPPPPRARSGGQGCCRGWKRRDVALPVDSRLDARQSAPKH